MSRITQGEYDSHDCHLSADDGCQVCTDFSDQHFNDKRAVDSSVTRLFGASV